MIDWVGEFKRKLEWCGDNQITIPMRDFAIMYDALINACSEYAGSSVIEEIYRPVAEKYESLFGQEE